MAEKSSHSIPYVIRPENSLLYEGELFGKELRENNGGEVIYCTTPKTAESR
jgi:hypothetical protein